MRALAIFGLHGGLNLAVQLLILVLVTLWLALAFWTYADARRRIDDAMLVACAAAASLFFPFVGAIVYAIVRPPEYLEDVRERELEMAAAEARLAQVENLSCQHCGFEIEKTFLRCPSCMRKLKEPCTTCGRPLDPRWKICPYCEAEVPQAGAAPAQRRRPARRAAPAAGTAAAAGRTSSQAAARTSSQASAERPARGARPADDAEPPSRPARARPAGSGEPQVRAARTTARPSEREPNDGAAADQPPGRRPTRPPSADPA